MPTEQVRSESAPKCAFEREVRLAIVMYGGVSLAVYINGIAQELLQLVQATAPSVDDPRVAHLPDAKLGGTGRVYRELARLGADSELSRDFERLAPPDSATPPDSAAPIGSAPRSGTAAPLKTRFVIDILSGTSAGGLNAVYLAKALANDQGLLGLKRLWMTDGEMSTLLNDSGSVADMPELVPQDPPQSLLNSQRMYRLLLAAFDQMKHAKPSNPGAASPYVDELDLYVTTTDIRGFPVTLRLRDHVVQELRHRHVFHLVYGSRRATGSHRNDFEDDGNPFLAFVARCTSAFPFAFEPMSVLDVRGILGWSGDRFEKEMVRWRRFFGARLGPGGGAPQFEDDAVIPLEERAYSDGGILDNRPFTYATASLQLRHADLPVQRKLLYLEPVPRHHERQSGEKPDAIETALSALTGIPAYESIREDLERVLEHNRQLGEIRELQQNVSRDLHARARAVGALEPSADRVEPGERKDGADRQAVAEMLIRQMPGDAYAQLGLEDLVAAHGFAYGTYHRLKVRDLIGDLAGLMTRAAGFEEGTGQNEGIRYIVMHWVRSRYRENPVTGLWTETRFVLDYDLGYRLRRLQFVRACMRDLRRKDETPDRLFEYAGIERRRRKVAECADPDPQKERERQRDLAAQRAEDKALREEIEKVAGELREVFVRLRAVGRILRARRAEAPVGPADAGPYARVLAAREIILAELAKMRIGTPELQTLLRVPSEAGRLEYAKSLVEGDAPLGRRSPASPHLDEIAKVLRDILADESKRASKRVYEILAPRADASALARDVRKCLLHYYGSFEAYDSVTYPLTYGTPFAESDAVEIVRFSPEDAPSLIDESAPRAKKKLAGTNLANFSAFLQENWRRNDMMWGRLDAAERIVDMMLPQWHPDRERLRRDAHVAILTEDLPPAQCERLFRDLVRRLTGDRERPLSDPAVSRQLGELMRGPLDGAALAMLRHIIAHREGAVMESFRDTYEVDRAFQPEGTMRTVSRATRIIGKLFEGVSDQQAANGRVFAWVTRIGATAWGFVEMAAPRSILHLLTRYWLKVAFLAATLLYLGGLLGKSDSIRTMGLKIGLLVAALSLVIVTLTHIFRGMRHWKLAAWVTYGLALLGCFAALWWTWDRTTALASVAPATPHAAELAARAGALAIPSRWVGWGAALLGLMAMLGGADPRPRRTFGLRSLLWTASAAASVALPALWLWRHREALRSMNGLKLSQVGAQWTPLLFGALAILLLLQAWKPAAPLARGWAGSGVKAVREAGKRTGSWFGRKWTAFKARFGRKKPPTD